MGIVMWNFCFITFILGNIFGAHAAISNLALHKPTQQKSTAYEGTSLEGSSEKAVDGNKNSDYVAGLSCTHTGLGSGNWWLVDLETTSVIYEVRIKNRLHDDAGWLKDLNILVGKTQDSWSLCDYYAGPAAPDEEVFIKCRQLITGRYVKLQKVNDTYHLLLCEVEVMGHVGKSGPDEMPLFICVFTACQRIYSFLHGKQGVSDQMISIDVKNEFQCALLCNQNPDCEHFNLNNLGTRKVCELLLSAVETIHDADAVTHYSLQ